MTSESKAAAPNLESEAILGGVFSLWLDRLILLWIMPPLGFLITVLQIPPLRYLRENYTVMAVLVFGISFLILFKTHKARTVLYATAALAIALAFTSIEWVHFISGRATINGLSDARMIIYSSFYGSVIVVVLYSFYLILLSEQSRRRHLIDFLKLMSCFHLFFLLYWFLLYFGWVETIPRADLLHSNSVSYAALFVLSVVLFFGQKLGLGRNTILLFVFINFPVIFVNGTRGAILGFVVLLLFLANEDLGRARNALALRFGIAALAGIVGLVAIQNGVVLGRDSGAMSVLFDRVYNAYQDGSSSVSIDTSVVSDESTISAFSRIGSNYLSLLYFMDNFSIGIGQAKAYSIHVLGSGVHSFHFLVVLATGIVGMVLLYSSIVVMFLAKSPVFFSRQFFILTVVSFLYSLIFINELPVYLALLVAVIGDLPGRPRSSAVCTIMRP